jgi:hypothetical protein
VGEIRPARDAREITNAKVPNFKTDTALGLFPAEISLAFGVLEFGIF